MAFLRYKEFKEEKILHIFIEKYTYRSGKVTYAAFFKMKKLLGSTLYVVIRRNTSDYALVTPLDWLVSKHDLQEFTSKEEAQQAIDATLADYKKGYTDIYGNKIFKTEIINIYPSDDNDLQT